jgi:uncharacterized protein
MIFCQSRILFILLIYTLSFSQAGFSADKNFKRIYKDPLFDLEFNLLKTEAENGIALKQFELANTYANPESPIHDRKLAFLWYEKAAIQDNPDAQTALSNAYFKGYGVAKNSEQGLFWLSKAVSLKDVNAVYLLAQIYYFGMYGINHDTSKAAELYLNAAKKGHVIAQFQMGSIYFSGNGLKKDISEAVYWYEKSAAQGNAGALNNLGYIYSENKNEIPQDYSKSAEYFRNAAEAGDGDGQRNLGRMYLENRGVLQDYEQGCFWTFLGINTLQIKEDSRLEVFCREKLSFEKIKKIELEVRGWKPSTN